MDILSVEEIKSMELNDIIRLPYVETVDISNVPDGYFFKDEKSSLGLVLKIRRYYVVKCKKNNINFTYEWVDVVNEPY